MKIPSIRNYYKNATLGLNCHENKISALIYLQNCLYNEYVPSPKIEILLI